MRFISPNRQRGITAIEVMIAASAVMVLVAFAVPAVSERTERSQLNEALDVLESSIIVARRTARIYQTEVVLSVQTGLDQTSSLSYLVHSPGQLRRDLDFEAQNYRIPDGIRLEADRDTIRFNAGGEVEPPAHLVLVSTANPELREQIVLE